MRFSEFKITEAEQFDPRVQQIQQELIKLGYNVGPTGADGIKGPATQAAAEKYLADVEQGKAKDVKIGGTTAAKLPKEVMPLNAPVTQKFGNKGHPGVDLGSSMGTPVHSPIDGTVQEAGIERGCGNTVSVVGGNEKHRFCHLVSIKVSPGQKVKAGDVIGMSGGAQKDATRGWSTGPHLHWEKYIAGRLVDPMTA